MQTVKIIQTRNFILLRYLKQFLTFSLVLKLFQLFNFAEVSKQVYEKIKTVYNNIFIVSS